MQKRRLESLDEGVSSTSSKEICYKEERRSKCAYCRRGSYRPFRAEEQGSVDARSFNRVNHRKGRCHSWCKGAHGKVDNRTTGTAPLPNGADDTDERPKAAKLNPEAPEFRTRPKRDAAIAASLRISDAVN